MSDSAPSTSAGSRNSIAAALSPSIPAGFAAAAAVWIAAFVGRIPSLSILSGPAMFAALLAVMLIGAFVIGWRSGRRTAMIALLIAGGVNILLVGSVANVAPAADASAPTASYINLNLLYWVPGSFLLSGTIGAIAGSFASLARARLQPSPPRASSPAPSSIHQSRLGLVIILSTLALITVGATVTSLDVGLAVPDWPTSFGYNMFLLPFSRMVGGIYYEHSHRLIGAMVGLQTLVWCAWLWIVRSSDRRLSWIALACLALVISQGILGGGRVALFNRFGNDVTLALAVAHACTAQLFVMATTYLTCRLASPFTPTMSAAIRGVAPTLDSLASPPESRALQAWDSSRSIALTLILILFLQALCGALLRHFHFDWALLVHILGAIAVVLLSLTLAVILLGAPRSASHPRTFLARLLPWSFIAVPVAQVLLGFISWWVTTRYTNVAQVTSPAVTSITAAHVVIGALLTSLSVCAAVRVVSPR